ncbi:unnamed protein product [Dracunculus medinensis]|uniref:Purple acid phosphatase n=1 Tax=Dracunculus medinensis TaxID=318479 RepID=A0A0N4U4A4_DRAME|nr:unnamed protein product [Dracunculus medinensis]
MRLILFLLIVSIDASRYSLNPERVTWWQIKGDSNQGPSYAQPEQVALSYGGDPTSMWITWVTFDDTFISIVEYGTDKFMWSKMGNTSLFIDGGLSRTKRYVHRVLLTNLKPGTRYIYHVGSEYGWSPIFTFKALAERSDGGFIYAVYGDLGNENARSLGKIQKEAQLGLIDVVLHIGDIAYNLDTDDGKFGDQFGRQIEPVAAYIPYMTVVGNHENAYNFSHFVNRYTMPDSEHNLFYSFDLGSAHFIAFSTEFYYFTDYGLEQIVNQWNWLNADLKRATKNRNERPWIITMGHRPMYCSNFDDDDCTKYESLVRVGLPGMHNYGLEKLFYTYGIDLEIWAHEHSYERMWPLYNRTIYNGTRGPYINPPAPVHVISGSAGCKENTDPFVEHPSPWSAFRSSNYGFSRMHIFNATHLYFEQIADEIEDSFWLIKEVHGPYRRSHAEKLKKIGTYVPYDYFHE